MDETEISELTREQLENHLRTAIYWQGITSGIGTGVTIILAVIVVLWQVGLLRLAI